VITNRKLNGQLALNRRSVVQTAMQHVTKLSKKVKSNVETVKNWIMSVVTHVGVLRMLLRKLFLDPLTDEDSQSTKVDDAYWR
jgi:hypothetical protein